MMFHKSSSFDKHLPFFAKRNAWVESAAAIKQHGPKPPDKVVLFVTHHIKAPAVAWTEIFAPQRENTALPRQHKSSTKFIEQSVCFSF